MYMFALHKYISAQNYMTSTLDERIVVQCCIKFRSNIVTIDAIKVYYTKTIRV